jgi:hypothetical protein
VDGNRISHIGESSYYTEKYALITDNLVAGAVYPIRIRALNVFGWSETSAAPYFTIAASGIPDVVQPVRVSYSVTDPTKIRV